MCYFFKLIVFITKYRLKLPYLPFNLEPRASPASTSNDLTISLFTNPTQMERGKPFLYRRFHFTFDLISQGVPWPNMWFHLTSHTIYHSPLIINHSPSPINIHQSHTNRKGQALSLQEVPFHI